ncbi:metal tolerance protein C2 [Selaginella moellendorffii]|uniref:metal tolerance protein C2 n=1 Tax=Selaginella moellendorffii TaxID=88036 RepID=UPI000D1D089F|nr:metal tolerance protein C2 [Selaginella moellendorffii]|eukprot:XP_024541974.1 metal tolerance protein C2 [Selaginella moellendorffii]
MEEPDAVRFDSVPLSPQPPGNKRHPPAAAAPLDNLPSPASGRESWKNPPSLSRFSPALSRNVSSWKSDLQGTTRSSKWKNVRGAVKALTLMQKITSYGNRQTKRLLLLILLNVAYSSLELFIGLLTGRIGLVSDAFHLTFGCGMLTFSLFAMVMAKRKADDDYTYGHKRLEVLAAFTNTLFLLFLAFSLAVEALHAFVQDESEHKHYLIVSAVANLCVNAMGVWFFRNYARISFVYRKAEDMNNHSICLHVLSDSIRSTGVILASWLLALGVKNAETLCLGIVSVAVFFLALPLFNASGGLLLQMSPPGISPSAFSKCLRQVGSLEGVLECYRARFWELVPGFVVGTLLLEVKEGSDEQAILKHAHSVYNDIGVRDLTVELQTRALST